MADKPIILGQQLAAARQVERARIAAGDAGPSPLGTSYDRWHGELDLADPTPVPLDEQISTLCREYAQRDAPARSTIRRSLSMDDFYTLLAFGTRAAVFGLRARDARWLADGLTASAMIEVDRIDWRDASGSAGLIYAIFHRLGIDWKPAFAAASGLAAPEMAEILGSFQDRRPGQEQITSWLYRFVDSPGGPGLIASWGHSYRPTLPLDQLIRTIARLLSADKYAPDVYVADDFKNVWLSGIDDFALDRALTSAVAAASASGTMRPSEGPSHYAQHISVSLVELASEEAAVVLSRLAQQKRERPRNFSLVAAQHGRLFCSLIARSVFGGVEPCESDETIMRFLPGIDEILRSCPMARASMAPTGKFGRWLRELTGRLFGNPCRNV